MMRTRCVLSAFRSSVAVPRCRASASASASAARCLPAAVAGGGDISRATAPSAAGAAQPLAPAGKAQTREEDIAARIAASRQRRASLPAPLKCPACAIGIGTAQGMQQHMAGCCPDLVLGAADEWRQAVSLERAAASAAVGRLISGVQQQEQELRQEAIRLTFRSGELDVVSQQPVRLSAAEVARRMQLPEGRVAQLIQRGMRAYPMPADPEPVEVLYEDEELLAALKPPGINTAPVHRFRGGSMVNRLIGYLGQPPYVLHRLDMDTSGLLLFAKTPQAVKLVAQQFRARTVSKWYLALCIGVPKHTHFHVHTRIARHATVAVARVALPALDPAQPVRSSCSAEPAHSSSSAEPGRKGAALHGASAAQDMSSSSSSSSSNSFGGGQYVSAADLGSDLEEDSDEAGAGAGAGDAKVAVTSCVVLSVNPDIDLQPLALQGLLFDPAHAAQLRGACLIACSPHTGRTHQIRVHCQHLGHPLLGDELYGVKGPWIGRQALHAAALLVQHPRTGLPLLLGAPLPEDMQRAVQALGLQVPAVTELPQIFESHRHDMSTEYIC